MVKKSNEAEKENQILQSIGKIDNAVQMQHIGNTIIRRTKSGCFSQMVIEKSIGQQIPNQNIE